MSELPDNVKTRLKDVHLQLVDVMCEIQKSATKVDVHCLFENGAGEDDRKKVGLVRDLSDSYIRMGSLLRRICDLIEPYTEEEKP